MAVGALPRTNMNETETETGSGTVSRWDMSRTTLVSVVSRRLMRHAAQADIRHPPFLDAGSQSPGQHRARPEIRT